MTPSDIQQAPGFESCSLRRTYGALAVFYVAALLLNSEGLHRSADRLPYGLVHDIALAVAAPVDEVGRTLRLTWLRSFVERMMNHQPEGISNAY